MNGQKFKITQEQADFINQFNKLNGEWTYIPFWFKSTDDGLVFEIYSFDHLPQELTQQIDFERGAVIETFGRKYPSVDGE